MRVQSVFPRLLAAGAAAILVAFVACTVPGPISQLPGSSRSASALSDSVDLIVASTTDVHGRIRAWDYFANATERTRGLSRAATIVDSLRNTAPGRVILLDAGDLLQGNPFAYTVRQESGKQPNAIVAAMNAMKYDAAAIGNHEFNYGVAYLDKAVSEARFPFLSDNTYRLDGSHAYKPWTIVERAGIKVGIIGATTPGVLVWDGENVRGKVTLGDIIPAVRQSVSEVKAAGAVVVVVTVHSGLDEPSSYDTVATGVPSENVAARIAREVPGIDLLLYGHSHREVRQLMIGNTLLVQPKNWATSVSVAHLTLARAGGKWSVVQKRADLVQAAGFVEKPEILAVTQRTHDATISVFTAPVGTTPVQWRSDSARLKDTPIVDFVLETEREATGADLASTAVFATDATFGPGPVTGAQMAKIYPYDNTLRVIRINGKQLRQYLDFSSRYYTGRITPRGTLETDSLIAGYNFDIVAGVDYTIDLNQPVGSRITRLVYKGKPVRDDDTFTFALTNYRQGGGGGYSMLTGSSVIKETGSIVPILLQEAVKRKGVIKQEDYFTQNWNIILPRAAR
ncbi:MAG: 5'-nucleotidase C-terminal domain-containing protein [Gemmatimonadaceae bacterium]|nr:5'-nucleotidase C-terminal domain-containing protein [Gemmatimonadaceae bacterium]